MTRRHAGPRRGRRLAESTLLTVAVATLALAVLGTGGASVFSLTERSAGASSGFASLGPISVNSPNNRLGVGAVGLTAGDAAQRVVDIRNTGTTALRRVTLTTKASPSSRLDTDRVSGLQLTIDRCPVAWTERRAAASSALTYSCPTKTALVLTSRPVVQTGVVLVALSPAPGAHNYLRVTLTFPANAPRSLQGQFSTIRYTFTAT